MQIRTLATGLVTALALMGMAAPAPGQARSQETVPLELVQLLVSGPFGSDAAPEVLVGRIPDATARVLSLPSDVRVVGSLVRPGYATSALAVPDAPAVVRGAWVERLLEAGWTRYQRPSQGGFESSPMNGLQFCRGDSISVSLDVSGNPRGGSYVRVMHRTGGRYSICQERSRIRTRMPEALIPTLTAPPGAVAIGRGSGGGGDERDAHARLRTDLSLDALIDHYGAQLRDHGWTPAGRISGQDVALEVFRVTDPEGAAWHGVLVASAPSAEADRFLSLRLTRVESSY